MIIQGILSIFFMMSGLISRAAQINKERGGARRVAAPTIQEAIQDLFEDPSQIREFMERKRSMLCDISTT